MLPSFRLVVAAFLCGFVVVSAALHLFATARVAQESTPQLAASVAALPGGSAHDWRRGAAAVPVMFDPRFAIDAATAAPTPAGLTLHAINRATGALSKVEPEKVALLPDRDSPASVMLPVPSLPAPDPDAAMPAPAASERDATALPRRRHPRPPRARPSRPAREPGWPRSDRTRSSNSSRRRRS